MAINKKLIHFENRANFDVRLANNEINDTSIVFIQDTGELWTHGKFFCKDYAAYADEAGKLSIIQTKTYTNVIGTANNNPGAVFYFMSVRPIDWNAPCTIKYRINSSIEGLPTGTQLSIMTMTFARVTQPSYDVWNYIGNTSYRPFYYHYRYFVTQAGYNAGYGHLIGLGMLYAYNPTTAANSRTFTIDVLELDNATCTMFASMTKYANVQGTGSTNFTSEGTFDGTTLGETHLGDRLPDYLAGSYYFRSKVNSDGYVGRYMLVMRCPNGTVTGLTTTNNSTGTTKTMYAGPLLLGDVFYYASTSAFAANGNFAHDGANIRNNYSLVDVRYTFNCGSTLVAYKPFFIVGSMLDGYFYLDQSQPWSQEWPTENEEGKVYILVGHAYDTYRTTFELINPVYIFKNGKLQLYNLYSAEVDWNNIIGTPSTFTPSAHDHDDRYLLLAGGTMTGPLKWEGLGALPQVNSTNYFLTIDSFTDGGTTKWIGKANALTSLTGLTSSAKGSITTPIYWTGSGFSEVQATFGSKDYGEHNANNIKSNGLWYYTSNGPTTTLGASTADGALYSQAYSTSWVAQIAQDYRNGNLFTRGLSNGTWTTWRKVWNDGNDGSDSGLDADLLDGKHAADFALSNHLYHKLTVNENYYESYLGENLFSIVTKNFRYDNLRFKSSTITDVQYWNYTTNEWQSWSKDLSPLFNGSGETNVSIPKENRKFRFCITSASGWPATAMFVLLGNYHNAGTITTLNGNYSNVIIETRNSDTEFVEKASFGFSTSFMGTNARVLSSLHTGDTIYRITIELASWTTENNAALKMIAIFSNFGNMPLQTFRHDGYGNIYPITSEKYSLGTSSYRWNGFYTTTASLSSTLSVAGALTFSGVPEGADNFSDGTELLTSVLGVYGFNTSGYVGKVYRRKALNMYNYLKGKFDTLYLGTSGNANTATEFASAQSITLTGDTTGTASSTAGWSIETTTKYLTGIIANSSASAPSAITTTPGTSKITYYSNVLGGTTGLYTTTNNANAILTLNRHTGSYDSQLGFSSNGNIYYRNFAGTALNTTQAWKQIAFTDSDITGQASYAANVGSAGTLGTNYVTAAKVIAACNWYDTVTGSDTDSVIDRWDEIVNFVSGFEETPNLATYLANNYLAKTGNSTASPMTGTIYVKDVNPLVLLSTNKDLDIWRVTGDSTGWNNTYGFYLRYNGASSGNDNSLSLWANNQTGNDIEIYRVKLDGILNFLKAPTINGTAISLTTHDHDDRYLKLTGGTLTGTLNLDSNTMGAVAHLTFNRQYSYIQNTASSGKFCFLANNAAAGASANADLIIADGLLYPGTSGHTSLGTTNNKFSLLHLSGAANIGGTLTASSSVYLTGLAEGTSDVTDDTELVTSYAGESGFANSTGAGKAYRRKASKLYNYIKSKTDSLYLPLIGGTMTGPINWGTGSTREILLFSTDSTWKSGLRYSWNSNTTVALWGKLLNTQFVWNAGSDAELNGTTTKTYDFLVGRDTSGTYNGKVVGRIAGNIIWNAGNDGSGSTLDADLLDGQHGSYYLLEANLTWGGKNLNGIYSPLDASMVGELGANRLAFLPANKIEVQYCTDGETWLDYEATDEQKVGLVSGLRVDLRTGHNTVIDAHTTGHKLRVILTQGSSGLYTLLNKFILYVTCANKLTTGINWCTIEGRTKSDYSNNIDNWSMITERAAISGWSGYNVINTTNITFGGTSTQTHQIRFTIGMDSTGSNSASVNPATTYGISLISLFAFGGVGWAVPSKMAGSNHLYDWDYQLTMILPGNIRPKTSNTKTSGTPTYRWSNVYSTLGDFSSDVTANKFIKSGGTSSQFLKADGSVDSNTYATTSHNHDSTYLKLSGGTMTGAIDISTSNSAIDTTKGINFTYSGATGHIGLSTLLGIYSSGNIVIRPNGGSTSGLGLDISLTSFKYNNTNVSLEGHTHSSLNVSTLGYLYQSATTTTGSTGTVTATSGKIGIPIQFYGSQVNYALNNDLFYATVASNAITENTTYLGDAIKSKTFVKTSTHVPTGASSSSSSGTSGESITYTAGDGIKIAGTLISTNTWTGTESLFAELANPSSYDLIYIIED